MDTFTRRYTTFLALLAAAALAVWLSSYDSRVSDINNRLAADPILSSYPYHFEVLSIEHGVARMHSPRSAQMSAIQGLRILFPELRSKSAVSDAMMAAQEQLAKMQSLAMRTVLEHPDVDKVIWVLDQVWLESNGVVVQ